MNLLAEIPMQVPVEELKCAPTLDLEVIDNPPSSGFKYFLKKGQIFNINA